MAELAIFNVALSVAVVVVVALMYADWIGKSQDVQRRLYCVDWRPSRQRAAPFVPCRRRRRRQRRFDGSPDLKP